MLSAEVHNREHSQETAMSDAHQRYRAIHQTLTQLLPAKRQSHQAQAIQVLSALICGIVGSQHTQFPQIARKSPGFGVKPSSRIMRYQRWVMNERVTLDTFYLPFVHALLTALAHQPLVLMMDGSTCGRGCLMLMLSLRYRGRALPLVWTVIRGKKGHFPASTHCALIHQIVPLLPQGADVIFLGDGEFDSTDLQRHLEELNWRYVCRTACNTLLWWGDEPAIHLSDLSLTAGNGFALPDVGMTNARYGPVLVLGVWEETYDHPLYLVSNFASATVALQWYRRRAHIETFFSDQKSRGFRIDKSHLSDPARLQRLLIAAALAYLWLIALGAHALTNRLVGQFHRTDRCDLSLFQLGLAYLEWLLDTSQPLLVAFVPVPALALPD
jgi:hypothetical protein